MSLSRYLISSIAVAIFWCPQTVKAELPATELTSLSRVVGQAASTFAVQVNGGAQLDEIDQLVFSHPGIVAKVQSLPPRLLETEPVPSFGNFDVTVSPDVAPGVYEVRVKGRLGLSNPRPFLVTSSPVQYLDQEHSTVDTAIDLSQQQIVTERTQPQRRNYFRIELMAGDRATIVAHARQLDSRALISMILIDPNGREVARARSFDTFPALLEHVAKKSGLYTLQTYDFLYQGGNEFYYALQATIERTSGEPNTASKGGNELAMLCSNPVGLKSVLREGRPGTRPTALDTAAMTATWLKPTDFAPMESREYSIPFSLLGNLGHNNRKVHHDFQAVAGQKLWIELASSKLDQSTDPRIVVYLVNRDGEGKESLQQVLEQDDAASLGTPAMRVRIRDPYAALNVGQSGTYRIQVIDNASGSRAEESLHYVLNVREAIPSFNLLAYSPFPTNVPPQSRHIGSNLMRGGTEAVHVIVYRRDGFSDPIEIRAEGLPPGVSCTSAICGRDATSATLVLQAAEDTAAWTGPIRIVGKSLIGTPIESEALYACMIRGVTPNYNAIASRMAADLCLHVDAMDIAPLAVQVGDGQVLEMSRGGKLAVPIRVTRRNGGATKCILRPQELPPKATIAEVPIEADKNEATAEMQIAPDAPTGEYTFWFQNECKVKWKLNPQVQDRLQAYIAKLKQAIDDPNQVARKAEFEAAMKAANEELEKQKPATGEREFGLFLPTSLARVRIVETPFRVAAVGKIQATPGSDAKLDVNIERLFGFADAVDISLQGNPPVEGIQITGVQIPAGAASGQIVVKIPEGAKATSAAFPIKLECKWNGHTLATIVQVDLAIAAAAAP